MNSSKSYSTESQDDKVLSFGDIDTSLTYSYAHYLTWLFDDRVELIRGQVFKMSPEYWVVSPSEKTFLKYTLDESGRYQPSRLFTLSEKVQAVALTGFELDLDAVFKD